MKDENNTFWFHGTNRKNAKNILKHGFKKGTHFTPYMDTAMNQGGLWIFEIYFSKSPSDYWEWISDRPISKDDIVWLRRFFAYKRYFSIATKRRFRHGWLGEYHNAPICEVCDGHGQLNPRVNSFRNYKKVRRCPKCNGRGVILEKTDNSLQE